MSNGTDTSESEETQPSMFGTYLSTLRVLRLDEDARCCNLAQMRSFYLGSQHDHADNSWDGGSRDPGVGYLQERMRREGFQPIVNAAIPLNRRLPSAPVPLARRIVTQFTDMLVGEGREPTLRCRQDQDDELFCQAVFREARAWDVLAQARDVAGACGSVAIANGVIEGKPYMEVLYPEHCWVPEWKRTAKSWVPRCLVHQILVTRTEQDPETGRLKARNFWQTRAWTEDEVIVYEDVAEDALPPKTEPWPIRSRQKHKWKRCPVVWYSNTRSTDSPDGNSDCDGTWSLLDKLDQLNSQATKAAIANADPTVVLKDSERAIRRGGVVRKGSGNVIPVGEKGDAKYLEISGDSLEAAYAAIDKLQQQILQTTRCVEATPEMAKSNESGEARQILWRPMESRANRLRVGLETAALEEADLWRTIGMREELDLPDMEVKDQEGESRWVTPRAAGTKSAFTVEYPPYWTPTAGQLEQFARGLSIAAGARPVFSTETASRQIAEFIGTDPDAEWMRVQREAEEMREQQQEQLLLKGSINLPNGPKPDQPGEPTKGNKPVAAKPKPSAAAGHAKKATSGNGVTKK